MMRRPPAPLGSLHVLQHMVVKVFKPRIDGRRVVLNCCPDELLLVFPCKAVGRRTLGMDEMSKR